MKHLKFLFSLSFIFILNTCNVGVNKDFKFGYRSEEEFKKWFKKDPVKLQRKKLLKLGTTEEEIIKYFKSCKISALL